MKGTEDLGNVAVHVQVMQSGMIASGTFGIKIGGSLRTIAPWADLRHHLTALAQRWRLLLLPGGGAWADLVRAPGASLDFLPQVVHGALSVYDLPDLLGAIPKEKVTVAEPLDPTEQPAEARN